MTTPDTSLPETTSVPPSEGSKRKTSVLAWVALGFGVLGFLFAILPVASFLAWLFTLPAFILAIIALTKKDKARAVPVIALLLSIIAFIVAIVVSVSTIVAPIGDSGKSDTSSFQEGEPAGTGDDESSDGQYDDYPTFDVIDTSGTGDSVIELPEGVSQGIVTAAHSGSSNFSISGLNASNESTGDLLVNTIGAYSGVTAFGFSSLSEAGRLSVTADGPWTVSIAPISSAPEIALPANGTGDAVYLFSGDASTWNITHDGTSNFAVIQYGGIIPNLAVNEIGVYQGSIPMKAGPSVLSISADGNWSITN